MAPALTETKGVAKLRFTRSWQGSSGSGWATKKKEDIDPDDLRNVSQVLYDQTGEQTGLQFEVGEFFNQFADTTTELHRNIAALPFKLCLTTSADDFLFNAFKEAGKTPVREYYDFRNFRDVTINEPSVQNPLVYHLYGYREPPESQVITEGDLIDFLTKVVKNEPPLPSYIRATLSKNDSTCLFIDLEFKQWYLRVLMHVLGYRIDTRTFVGGGAFGLFRKVKAASIDCLFLIAQDNQLSSGIPE